MKKFLLLTILIANFSFAYTNLYVQDPRGWRGGTGTIEDAVVSIKPLGIYMETDLYLTFSARDLGFNNSDTLEVQYYFDLPENAIVYDSWLWMGEDTIKAKIMDQWTASSIYENIVKRRRDPSILFKRGATNYELRIFPMAGDQTRKVKISYLVPTEWNSSIVTAPLPTDLFRVSLKQLNSFVLNVQLSKDWKNPQILEYPNIVFQSVVDSISGNFLKTIIPKEAIQNTLNFTVNSPLNNGIFLSKYENANEGIYQMAFLPSKVLNISEPIKAAILIDYDASMSTVSKTELLANLKSAITSNFSSKDSFNLIFSKANINRISDDWIQADSVTIDSVFKNLTIDQIADYGNLPSLLADGIDFVKSHGNDGNILLVANTDQVGDYQAANQLIDDLLKMMDPLLPINVVNFQNQNYSYHWFGGRYYYGNEYFYENITRITSAGYFSILNSTSTFSKLLASAFQSLSGFISSFDLHTKLENGFCYARYNLDLNTNSVYLNKPILQIGKYQGTFPFIIEASGVYKNNPFSEKFTLKDSSIINSDSLNEEMWGGNYIKSLENQSQSNEVINEIVYTSIDERVLSIYSAFICLDPSLENQVCYDCMDNGDVVIGVVNDSTKSKNDSLALSAYPNPFNSQINLRVKLPDNYKPENVTFKLYNILGQLIKTFDPGVVSGQKEIKFRWDGKNDHGNNVSSGNYFFVVSMPGKVQSMKLVLLK
jgi:Vault protein inter-alpha-trypsin domain/FlgD Ig-like domain